MLFEAVSNLTENAVAATPAGGQVWLRAACNAETFEIEVRDSASGLPQEMMERLIPGQRFGALAGRIFKAPDGDETGSSGLGVAVVQEIIRAIGGKLDLQNRPSGGLTARITITPRETPSRKARPDSPRRPPGTES